MNIQQLSVRLGTVASFVPENARLADIGSDHAYLPCVLAARNVISYALAGEVVKGPFESATEQIRTSGVGDRVSARLGDGMDVIEPTDHINVVTICGMGGDLISKILEKGRLNGKLVGVERLILQPNNGEKKLREWLIGHSYKIIDETILEENGKIYEIIVAEKAVTTENYSDLEYSFGRFLLQEKNETFRKKWLSEIDKCQYILDSMQKASNNLNEKEQQVINKINEIKEVLE
ncbi:tRNA (adenine(22)-N(1))-methyltransferase TrmK [uncultured Trichococcus sp.]|uniref:tRNA (adenine(22)-N(1))-methyltransferase n=1 Tax=uncultured Trichococcus sp. TaxID=189665 RepID=UPI002A18BC06|nr:tRNA (adenine(22)-N(1))-methyltransferase TrmK [uncultured Trichococcus sp.]